MLVCNHLSFVDAVLVMGASPRPVRFVMDHQIFAVPLMRTFFRHAQAIPIAARDIDPVMFQKANDAIDAALGDGELVCIFPEGRITDTGEISPFKPGTQRIVERNLVPVVPMALTGLWGSFFSRYGGAAFTKPIDARLRRGLRARVRLLIGEVVPAQYVTTDLLEQRVNALLLNCSDEDGAAAGGSSALQCAPGIAPSLPEPPKTRAL